MLHFYISITHHVFHDLRLPNAFTPNKAKEIHNVASRRCPPRDMHYLI